MKSIILTITVSLMLVAFVAADIEEDIEIEKEIIAETEGEFIEAIESKEPKLLAELKSLDVFDNDVKESIEENLERWTNSGYSQDQIEELTTVFRDSMARNRKLVEKILQ